MDTTNLVVVVKYSDERGILRFTQTIKNGVSEVESRGMDILFDSDLNRNDRQVIVLAYTPDEHRLGLAPYDVPVTVQAGDVVPYSSDKVLAFVAAYTPSDLELSQHRLKHLETLKQRKESEDAAYPVALQESALAFAARIAEIKQSHEAELAHIAALDAYLFPMAGDHNYIPPIIEAKPPVAPTIDERLAELDNLPGFGIIPISATVSDEDIERIRREWAMKHPDENGAAAQ